MTFLMKSWHLLLLSLVGIAQRENERKIELLIEQVRMLKRRCGKRVLLTDDERRILAVKGKALGRRALEQVSAICCLRSTSPRSKSGPDGAWRRSICCS